MTSPVLRSRTSAALACRIAPHVHQELLERAGHERALSLFEVGPPGPPPPPA
jgi:hypothetical protein